MQIIVKGRTDTTQWIFRFPNPQLWPYADLWSKLKCTLKDLVVDSGTFFHQEK